MPPPALPERHLLLVGGGHAHVFVLESLARKPEPGLRVTLVCKDVQTPYSGMLPGHMAGLYAREAMHIDLERLAGRCGARLIRDEAIGFDRAQREVRLRGGGVLAYDLLSIDIGIVPDLTGIEGAAEHALAVKPIGDLLPKWDRLVSAVQQPDGPRRVAVVGGGVAGICLAFAAAARLRGRAEIALIGDTLGEGLNEGLRRRIRRALHDHGIAVHEGEAAERIGADGVVLEGGSRVAADAVLVSTRAAPPEAFRGTDLARDAQGFLAISRTLQVLDDPRVFAAGDCATIVEDPRPRAGVFAVRQGPVLARNLRRASRGEPLENHAPQRDHLVLIATGDGRAIGGRGRFVAFEGRLAWWLKDWLDRRFMRRFS